MSVYEGREMSMLEGLPVAGYSAQSADRVALVNQNKELEEQVLRAIEGLAAQADPRWLAIARTQIELGFMSMNRAIFQPSRVILPGGAL